MKDTTTITTMQNGWAVEINRSPSTDTKIYVFDNWDDMVSFLFEVPELDPPEGEQ